MKKVKIMKENKKLKDKIKNLKRNLKVYSDFWETDAIEDAFSKIKLYKEVIYVLIIIISFLIGLNCR